jgi:uncharacterized repeat protein (TIGR01451 family)
MRGHLLVAGLLTLALLLLGAPQQASEASHGAASAPPSSPAASPAADPGATERVSVGSAGNEPTGYVDFPAISGNGRYVAFTYSGSDLVSGDTNGAEDVLVHDRQTGITERVSVDSAGAEGNTKSTFPAVSGDGRYVAFASVASNLVPGDSNGQPDTFVHDRQTGITERVSVDSAGNQANRGSGGFPAISADGRYVAFHTPSSNLVPGDTNGVSDVFVHDRQMGITERVSVDSDGNQANWGGEGRPPAISADGRYVAFRSGASNLVPGDTNGVSDVFVHDRQTGITERVSVDSDGNQGNGYSDQPAISGDGRYVTFWSEAFNLVPDDTNTCPGYPDPGSCPDIFIHDRQTGATELVSVDSTGNQANLGRRGDNGYPSPVSSDGRFIAFESEASNLVQPDTNGTFDIFVRDRQAGKTTRVSVSSGGSQGNYWSFDPAISANGRYVAFRSVASNLVSGDSGVDYDVFVHDRCPYGSCWDADPWELLSTNDEASFGLVDAANAGQSDVVIAVSGTATTVWPTVHATHDGGQTWTKTDWGPNDIASIAIDPSGPSVAYIGDDEARYPFGTWVFKTVDHGDHWFGVGAVPTPYASTAVRLEVDPCDSNLVYAMTRSDVGPLFRSADGGETWARVSTNLPEGWWSDGHWASQPEPACALYFGYFGGVFKSTDKGTTWSPVSEGLGAHTTIRGLAGSTAANGRLYAQACVDSWTDCQVFTTTDPSAGWEQAASLPSGCWLGSVATNSATPDSVFVTTSCPLPIGSSVYRSDDGGQSWRLSFDLPYGTASYLAASQNNVYLTTSAGSYSGAIYRLNLQPHAPHLSIAKSGPASVPATVDTGVAYTVTVTNYASATATGLSVTDILPQALRLTSATWSKTSPAGSGTCSLEGATVSCAIGDLAPGGTATVSLATTLRYIPTNGSISNMACWSATDPAPVPGQNCATATTGVGGIPSAANLRLTMFGPMSVPSLGSNPVNYELQVTNMGPGQINGVAVTDRVDKSLAISSATWLNTSSSQGGTCGVAGQVVTCNIGALLELESARIQINTTVSDSTRSSATNWAWAWPTDSDPRDSVAMWVTQFSGPHRRVVFIQGINSDSECRDPAGSSFRERVRWIEYYLTGFNPDGNWIRGRYFPLVGWSVDSPGDFRYFSYSGNYTCPGAMAEYGAGDTCGGIQIAADRLGQYLNSLLLEDPDATFDLIAHSMGGLVAALWIVQHQGDATVHRINSVVTFDSPLGGLPMQNAMGLVFVGRITHPLASCGAGDDSISDLVWEDAEVGVQSFVVRDARNAGDIVPFYTIDATRNETMSGRTVDAVPGDRTRMVHDDERHVLADRNHSGVWEWLDDGAADDRGRVLQCVGNAVVGRPTCTSLHQQLALQQGESQQFTLDVSPEDAVLSTTTLWAEGTITTSLRAPDGTVIDAQTVDPLVLHWAGEGYEMYEVHQPIAGTWTFEVTGVTVPSGGTEVSLSADAARLPPPDEDSDGSPDGEDNCQSLSNADQSDVDGDGLGDACDPDIDNDGLANGADNCPYVANVDQTDLDGDGLGEPCDGDNDNDLMPDASEALHACLSTSVDDSAEDPDADGLVNLEEVWLGIDPCDPDTDGDSMPDGYEMSHSCLDPLADDAAGDPDSDGSTSYEEYLVGTDPCSEETACGDVDCDNDVDAVDALFILQYVVGLRLPSDQCPPPEGHLYLPAANVDCDDDVDAVDALFVLQHVVGLRPELCVCPEP